MQDSRKSDKKVKENKDVSFMRYYKISDNEIVLIILQLL